MKYKLNVYSIWELGKRENQEDSIFPKHNKAKSSDRTFILCDGMGGHSAGEVASETVCQALSRFALERCQDVEGFFTYDDFKAALEDTFNILDTKDNGASKKMGTTLAFLKFHAEGAMIAHIGDSRVYHIRPGQDIDDTKILFQTKDHSLINDLIKIGELTPEEAKYSKQKNVITRAMQPCMEFRPKADLYDTKDIQSGDYFMLCSDGILEQIEDDNLRFIFSDKGGNAENKVDILKKVTEENRDNHSAIVVHVLEVKEVEYKNANLFSTNIPPSRKTEGNINKIGLPERKNEQKNHMSLWIFVFLLFVLLLILGHIVCKYIESFNL